MELGSLTELAAKALACHRPKKYICPQKCGLAMFARSARSKGGAGLLFEERFPRKSCCHVYLVAFGSKKTPVPIDSISFCMYDSI